MMGAMASRITSLTIVYSTVYSGADNKKPSKFRFTGLCAVNSPETGEFPAQRASNAENISIWWCHHVPQIFNLLIRIFHFGYITITFFRSDFRLLGNALVFVRFHHVIDGCVYKAKQCPHFPLDKMAAISRTIFSYAFSWMKSVACWLKFHWSLFLRTNWQ